MASNTADGGVGGSAAEGKWKSLAQRDSEIGLRKKSHERYYCPAEVPVLNSHPSYRVGVCGCVLLYISVRITYLIAYLIVIHLTHNFICYEILHKHKKNDKICVDYNICS